MRRHFSLRCLKERRRGAVVIVVLVLLCPWCVNTAFYAEKTAAALQESGNEQSSSVYTFLAENFMDVHEFSQVRLDKEAGVCSFESTLSAKDTLDAVADKLKKREWEQCSFHEATNASFYRESGRYTNAYVVCSSVQGVTVVVCNLI